MPVQREKLSAHQPACCCCYRLLVSGVGVLTLFLFVASSEATTRAVDESSLNFFGVPFSSVHRYAIKRLQSVPFSGGIYGKRSAPAEQSSFAGYDESSSFSDGSYNKRYGRVNIPFSGGIYGKRSVRSTSALVDIDDEMRNSLKRRTLWRDARAIPFNGGLYGRRR